MKFARYRQDGAFRIGIVEDDGAAIREMAPAMTDMLELIDTYDALRPEVRSVGDRIPLGEVELDAPIPSPRRNIFCVGKNYREHAKEFAQSGYEAGAAKGTGVDDYPAVFTKPASTVVGPRAPVSLHRTDDKKDIYTEAKGEGFDTKILREVVRLRKQDKNARDERDSLLDVYMHALETGGTRLAQAA